MVKQLKYFNGTCRLQTWLSNCYYLRQCLMLCERRIPKAMQTLGIKAAPVLAYHPEANGITEAKVKALNVFSELL